MKSLILQLILLILTLFFFKALENTLISWNFSWTISKVFPYLVLIILGFTLSRKIKKFFFIKIPFLRFILLLIIFLAPFGIGFILNPIYEGDFSKNGTSIPNEQSLSDFKAFDLVVITIPNCPFCHESVNAINLIQKRNPKLKIKYVVCAKESREIEPYKLKLNSSIQVSLCQNLDKMITISKGSFPCFVKINTNDIYTWSNDNFGVRAKDILESEI